MTHIIRSTRASLERRVTRRARLGSAAAALLVVGASVVAAPTAGATQPRPTQTNVAPVVPQSQPQALAAQPEWYPLVAQMVERVGGDADMMAGAAPHASASIPSAARWAATSDASVGDDLVERGFHDLLGRSADQVGLTYFEARIQAHNSSTFEWVLRVMADSSEFAHQRANTADRINAIYQAMLGRSADATGLSYFSSRLANGMSPGSVVAALQHSGEYGRREVRIAYDKLMWRTADTGALNYWSNVVNSSGRVDLWFQLLVSSEFARFGCDPIAGNSCMLPWPNNYFTRPDPTTATGLRVNLKPTQVPKNASGTPIGVSQINRSDGFSPGSPILVQVPGINLDQSNVPTIDHLDRNGVGSPVLLYDTDAHQLVPTWSELDVHDTYADPSKQVLIIHPVKNLTDGHHYIVGLRNLKNEAGQPLTAPPVFRAYRDGTASSVPGFAQRATSMNSLIDGLGTKGIARASLYLAWDFTVASTANLTGRLVHMRDDAFAQLGSSAPTFAVTSSTPGTHTGIARVVEGTFAVPNYLTGTGAPGSTFNEDASGLPARNGTFNAAFRCVIPTSALTTPARASLYGHGLFGSVNEVTAGNVQDMAAEHNMVFCGSNWVGMSNADIGTAAGVLQDLSIFNKLADPLQQGVLNFLFLARLMKMSPGLATDPAFQNDSGTSVLAPGHVYYDGNSQGGIEGGVVMAVSTDITRGVLGVSGMNYPSLLLPRSTDFTQFEAVLKPAYPAELDRVRALALVQLQWDRAEPSGYANHMTTDPLPGTPQHQVLMQIALGDHQVSDYAADTEARTIGAKAHCPAFDTGRVPDTRLLWGIDCISSYPYAGSAIVYFDSGADLPVLTDTPPPDGHDPHEDPRNNAAARSQKSAFLQPDETSAVIDVCGGAACHASQQ